MTSKTPSQYQLPKWEATQQEESLHAVYQWAIQNAESQIRWYADHKRSKRLGSQVIRAGAIFFAALGALCPLLDATGFLQATSQGQAASGGNTFAQWGYVLFAIAAAIVGFDRYFGLSTGWMRYIVTQMALEKALKEFQHDWLIMRAQAKEQKAAKAMNALTQLQKVRDFTSQVESLVKQETDAWVLEFQNNISQLEKVLKTEAEARKPGSIKVNVGNASDFDRVFIRLNDSPRKELVGVTEGLIEAVPPGQYEVTVIGKKGAKESKISRVVEVQPNVVASVDVSLKT
jgi:hypothetical protein